MKYQSQEKSFLFQNQKNTTKNINDEFKTKYDHNATQSNMSVIKMLQIKQNKANINAKFETKIDKSKEIQKEPSIIRLLKNQQKKIKNIDDNSEKKIKKEPSIIRMLKNEEKIRNIDKSNLNIFKIKTEVKKEPFNIKKQEQLKSIYKHKTKINIENDKRLHILLINN